MNKLREAAQAVVQCFDTHGFVLEHRIKALRDALAEPDEVLAEREACARMFDGEVWAYDYREIAAAIRARGEE